MIGTVYQRLIETYSLPTWTPSRDPLGELILTILSQHTTDQNSYRAYQELRHRYAQWEDVREASISELYATIKSAGLGNIKAQRIQSVLHDIIARCGHLNLDFLDMLTVDEGMRWLTALHGVGPKTTACVLMFSLGKPTLPIDTHVYRVAKRIGLISSDTSVERAHTLLASAMPSETVYAFHMMMIQHGRKVCHARKPRCPECILQNLCSFARSPELASMVS
ncbi:MAG: hypothetical protein GFH27_549333n77 [Chloroflexi bacterium AL-W]|nr:hypothetical protein [Chloroflexi bacterium AL-N1]NOK70470.1 hypothetical protein [Chloroflexi bacterium AL-N10]NOK78171.1 hypothetical protein [Chloroflexi bacterium AL-N5]NOK85270.1 hypothetical protein [Chloroflexi bacterium AL-W]NOK92035.1 hypothetical protein [Chloroflexi bacterium AL-N15]